MATGEIEVLGKELEILNTAATPPFQMDEYTAVGEEVRLHYRYMDLRRPEMQERLRLRSAAMHLTRRFLEERGFISSNACCCGVSHFHCTPLPTNLVNGDNMWLLRFHILQ